jgi:hypothetical protein
MPVNASFNGHFDRKMPGSAGEFERAQRVAEREEKYW